MPSGYMDKTLITQYWDGEPCGTRDIPYPIGSLGYFEAIAERRDRLEPFIPQCAQFKKWKGKKVLEVGCGVGSDLIRFAQAGADVVGIDLSTRSVLLAGERLRLYKYMGTVVEADAENIPYRDDTFDFVYSFGVLHHASDIEMCISEIYRVLKPGGEVCIMLYHRRSIVALQMYLLFGLLRFRPFRSIDDILASHHESIGTKAYRVEEARQLFFKFSGLRIYTHITSYDLRYWRDRYLPMWVSRIIPKCFGWNIIVRGIKP